MRVPCPSTFLYSAKVCIEYFSDIYDTLWTLQYFGLSCIGLSLDLSRDMRIDYKSVAIKSLTVGISYKD